MKTLIRKAAIAAALVTLAPAVASACEPEPPKAAVSFGVRAHVPIPAPVVVVQTRLDARHELSDADPGWRERAAWREREARRVRERAALRAEYARLSDAREDFYAAPHRRWQVRRFEAWYAQERAALDARWQRVA
jgi:hypothetical protein